MVYKITQGISGYPIEISLLSIAICLQEAMDLKSKSISYLILMSGNTLHYAGMLYSFIAHQ